MNTSPVCFFLPTRKGSERVINKNTRPFAGINGGLLETKLRQLSKCSELDEIILSTNDAICAEVAERSISDSRFRIVWRPDELCQSSTNLQDLIRYVPTITTAEHILWGHVTTPLAGATQYDDAIKLYRGKLQEGYDSLVGVCELRNFLLNKQGAIINNTTNIAWPRTQDLEIIYEINHTIFLASRAIYLEQGNRLGTKPFLFNMNKINSFDVDWEEDFQIAETLYKQYAGTL